MMKSLEEIVKHFKISGNVLSLERYGEGHINETYLLETDDNGKRVKYIFQKINSDLFTDVDKLMSNITAVTEFARARIIERGGDPDRETLNLVKTSDGKSYYYDPKDGGYYRIYLFITDAIAYQSVEKAEDFYQSAVAFGEFTNLLAEFDTKKLYELLPGFHDTRKRLKDFERAVAADVCGRAKNVKDEIEFVLSRKEYAGKIAELLDSGKMPTRVTHNDTKLNNVLLDAKTGKYLSVIDLDTIMPGSLCYDFGDSIRFGCNSCGEDASDVNKVNFRMDYFEAYVKGYLSSVGKTITKIEKDNLALGAIILTYECGMRFLTDYLSGDAYFKMKRKGQNLDRARTHFKLITDMEKRFDEMKETVDRY